MTRIIAGRAGGRRLAVPAAGTRPTADRVRESLFASLTAVMDFDGAHVLDLYAGSGALGLEALSRGAAKVVLVEQSPAAVRVIRANIAAVDMEGASVERATVATFLRTRPRTFDLVLLDPPYDLPDVADVLARLTEGWLAPSAVVVVERDVHSAAVQWPDGFDDRWNRRFGSTRVFRAVWYGHDQV